MFGKCAKGQMRAAVAAVAIGLVSVQSFTPAQAAKSSAETMSNRDIITKAYDKWAAGHGEVFNLLTDDAVLVIPGSGPSAGTWNGKQAFMDQVAKPFLSRFAAPPRVKVNGIYADGDTVVAHFDLTAMGKDGAPYNNSYAWLFEMDKGMVTKLTMYYDLQAFDAMKLRVPASAETAAGEYAGGGAVIPDAGSIEADKIEIKRLATEWLEVGWRHMPGDPPFNFKRQLSKFYDWESKDVYLFDDIDPQKRVARSPGAYGAIWDEMLQGWNFSNKVEPINDVLVSGDIAVAPVFYNITVDLGKEILKSRILSMVTFRRTADGWKIIREQGSGLSKVSTPK
ncbi:MAG TPA: nuclear transport factor 2 family protein [Kiritimatiellia bacterium]|nr:nuclear transport factor 2 family protein [Sphingobium sp.]HOO22022.1 nuclear transport factor 2 family protein [Kiritimatiellia bacterium]